MGYIMDCEITPTDTDNNDDDIFLSSVTQF